jgi:deoxyribonuclease V
VAKSYFKIDGVDFTMPANEQYSYTDIVIGNEVYGRVLRTHKDVKPIFLSIGNKIDLDTATQITNSLITNDGHIPLPTRLADIMTHEIRKKSLKEYERY